MTPATIVFRFKKQSALSALLVGLAVCAAVLPARADDTPFEMDKGGWMSFDHYKDADQRGITTPPTANASPAAPAPAVTDNATAAAPAAPAPDHASDVAFNPPALPSMNKGFSLQATSTEEEHAAQQAPATEPKDKAWEDMATYANSANDSKNAAGGQEPSGPLHIRMSYLPNAKVEPTPTPEHPSALSLNNAIIEQQQQIKQQQSVEKTEVNKAACAAIDSYKKQQLDAIQKDRQTLKALQDAISSLGLQKQLGFMTGNNGALAAPNAQSGNTGTVAVR